MAGHRHVSVTRVETESGDVFGVGEQSEGRGICIVVAQSPNVTAHIIGEDVIAEQLGDAAAAINHTAGDGVALVCRAAVAVFLDGISRSESDRRGGPSPNAVLVD